MKIKPMLVNKDFQTCIWLVGSAAVSQSEAMLENLCLTNMDFNMDFIW